MDDQIGAQAAFFRVDGLLSKEIAVRRHPCQLHDAPQSQLAPLSLDLRLLERVDQTSGFLPQFLVGRGKQLHLAAEAAVRFLSGGLDAGHFRAKVFQGGFERVHHGLNGNLALLEIPFGFLLKGIEFRLSEFDELVAAGLQGFAGQRLESFSQLHLGVIEQAPLFGKIRSLRLGFFLRGGAQLLFLFNSLLRDTQVLLQCVVLFF